MIRTLAHRGPDGFGFHAEPGVGLAHARLSIIDLSTGAQPIHNPRRNVWTVFNGEIFNYVELRAELEAAGAASAWDAFRDACHALKGAAGNMGAVRLSESASQGMSMPSDELGREWAGAVRLLRQQLEQALTALRAKGDLDRDVATGPDSA